MKIIGGARPGSGRKTGTTKTVVIRNRAIKFLEQTLKNESADCQARVMSAIKLIELNPEVQTT